MFRKSKKLLSKKLVKIFPDVGHLLHTTPKQLVLAFVHGDFGNCLCNYAILLDWVDEVRVEAKIGCFEALVHELIKINTVLLASTLPVAIDWQLRVSDSANGILSDWVFNNQSPIVV